MTHKTKIILIQFILICTSIFAAQAQITTPKKYTIKEIKVEGVKYLQHPPIVKVSGLSAGQTITVPGPDITNAMEKLWQQGLFSDVKIIASKIEGNNIYLTFYLKELARLNSLTIKGAKKSEEEDIREMIDFQTHVQLTENKKNIAVKKIRDYFNEKGFYHTDINLIEKNDSSKFNKSDVTIIIDRNNRIKIGEISFYGNTEFKDSKLRRFMKETKRKSWFVLKKSKYIPHHYNTDKQAIIDKYKTKGYRDAVISKDTVYDMDSLLKKIEITIDEGKKYYFRNITWLGNSKYEEALLERFLAIKKGDIYNEAFLQEKLFGMEGVSSIYLDNGYLFFNAEPIELNVENDSVDIQIRIYEGPQAVVNKIIIEGNTKTNDHVIYREIRTKPGSLFSRADIIRTQRELAMLGYFDAETMGINPKPNPEDGTVDIEYVLQEKSNDQIEISGGWSGEYVVASVRLVLNNFSLRNALKAKEWRPIPSGDGQNLSISASVNPRYYQYYSASFTEPWFGGKKPNALSITAYYSIRANGYDRDDIAWGNWRTIGTSIGMQRDLDKPDDFFTLYHDIGYKKYILNNYNDYLPPALPDTLTTRSVTLGLSFGRNSINQPLYPTRGSMFSLRCELTPPFSAFRNSDDSDLTDQERYKWLEYHKWTFKSKMYTEIIENFVLETRLDMGFLGYYNKNYKSPFEGFDVGGDGLSSINGQYGIDIIPIRGYTASSLTPQNGGNIYTKLSLELRYPITLKQAATIYGLIFAEAGNAWSEFKDYNPFNLKRSAGFGVRVYIPMMGLLGFDFGYGFDSSDENPNDNSQIGKWQPTFVLGQQF